jgi:hypothetical protein
MTQIKNVLHCLSVVALLGLLTGATLCIITVRATVKEAQADAHALTAKAAVDMDEAHRLLLEAGLTAREARLAATEERKSLGRWNKTADSTNALLASLRDTTDGVNKSQARITEQAVSVLQQTNTAIAGLAPLTDNVNKEVTALNAVTGHLDAVVSNKHIDGVLAHLDGTTAHLDSTTGHVDAMAKDAEQKVHAMLHPKWSTRLIGIGEEIALDAAKVLF